MAPIKIIHVIPNLESGGAQRHLLDVLRFSDKTKFKHQVVVIKKAGFLLEDFQKADLDVVVLDKKFKADLGIFFKIYQIIKKEKPALVMTHLFGGHLYGRLAAKLAHNCKITAVEDVVHYEEPGFKIFLKRSLLGPLVDGMIAMSQEVKDWIVQKEKIDPKKIQVVHNGFERDRFINTVAKREEASAAAKRDKEIIIGTVALLKKQKGLSYLIKAFAEVKQKFPLTKLWLIGGARQNLPHNEKPELEALVKDLGLEQNVVFWGDQKNIPKFLKQMDIFVLPSIYEGFGIVVLEAWASRLPVIASRLKCIEEYAQDQRNLLFAKPADVVDLKQKIEKLIQDNALRQKLAEAGFERSKDFDIQQTVKKYEEFFKQVIKGN